MIYTLLFMALASFWFSQNKKLSLSLSCVFLLASLWAGHIQYVGLGVILLVGLLAYISQKESKLISFGSCFLFVVLALALKSHIVPGFENILYFYGALSELSVPYKIYLNFNTPWIAIFWLSFAQIPLLRSPSEFVSLLPELKRHLLWAIPSCLIVAYAFGYIAWDFKLPGVTPLWILRNLFVVCLVEELLFREIIQKKLHNYFGQTHKGKFIAIFCAASLFGLAHWTGGVSYVALATLAGIFYGHIYAVTKRIEASILLHFLLNLVHFLLFTYPRAL